MKPLLEVINLKKHFSEKKGILKAVDDVSFSLYKGETLALVGESGSGKSTLAKTLLRLHKPTSGKVFWEGEDLFQMKALRLQEFRQKMQIVFQNPTSALNPRMTVRASLEEAFFRRPCKETDLFCLLDEVGLSRQFLGKYPHELSGGQKQRVSIARALATKAPLLILDEPVSSLDVSIQAQIVNLLLDLQKKFELTYLFISHDLALVEYMATRVAVMYRGSIVEMGSKEEIFQKQTHPYAKKLFASMNL